MIAVRGSQDDGFSLVELLVVVVIIGVLAAIAVPAYLDTRQRSFDSAALSDLRNLMAVESGLLASQGAFTDSAAAVAAQDWRSSVNVVACARTANGGQDVTLAAWHTSGGTLYTWDSNTTLTSAVAAAVPADCAAAIAPGAQQVS